MHIAGLAVKSGKNMGHIFQIEMKEVAPRGSLMIPGAPHSSNWPK